MSIQSKNNNRVFRLAVLTCVIKASLFSHSAFAEDYRFDSHLLAGSDFAESVDLDKFNETQISVPEGPQTLDISLNGIKIKSQVPVQFRKVKATDKSAQPCLDVELMKLLQLKSQPLKGTQKQCVFLSEITQQGSWKIQQSTLTLNFLIPQILLNRQPRDYIPISEWNAGAPLVFLRHNTNFTRNIMRDVHYNYVWSMINAGANMGMWQLRHQANLRYMESSTSGDHYKWNTVRTWVQRPVPSLSSELMVGDTYTDSSMFGSMSFNGVKLATDQRMWAQGKRGYAPEVRGVASTNARVMIRQAGNLIYETQVPPGPFLIDDLYNTRSQGDLQVQVIEADGKSSFFVVPYAAVPNSMRPGNLSYQFAAGKVRNYYSVQNAFTEGVLQYGVNNSITSNTGARFANDYQALLVGGVFASELGALSLNTTWSHARVENDQSKSGWRAEMSYSKTFETNTNIVLAAYRYSTAGYRDLEDVLGVRRQENGGTNYYSDTLKQRNRFTATLSQNMGDYGTVALSGSSTDYYNNRSRITELQLSYNNMWKKLSYNINVGRQRSSWSNDNVYSVNDADYDSSRYQKYTENVISIGLSVPLDWRDSRSSVSFDMMKDKNTRSAMTTLSGSAGQESDFTYSVYANHDKYTEREEGKSHDIRWGTNVQERTRMGTVRASYARSDDYHQLGLGTAGTLAVHGGGVTYGPYASDTFALVEAKGATGARVNNAQGAQIDTFGYAIVPSLAPYRYNTISIDGNSMSQDVELEGGNVRVVPVLGAVPKIAFKTLGGTPALITVMMPDGTPVPMGADVKDSNGNSVGMAGQSGQVYARLPAASGTLFISWGSNKSCRVNYQLPAKNKTDGNNFILLNGTCVQ
ncbi:MULTISPECIES: fimbrial outer membrane usher protein [Rahnella]|uniref:Fimbrial outer membrane usher protein n=1 Tax=Rahnella laticis TaxID=2787622 RepID=A0ABS0E8Q5_9GAMM|nr:MULTISPECIES: fimbrial outer membrane usher protein [Rahnella]MBF7981467.1 fimbrial outer membrane usher protein [Rahnella laticis]MBF8001559.1 fimbrial outer membrane usher protein [Rahnella sp. LAC-M12]